MSKGNNGHLGQKFQMFFLKNRSGFHEDTEKCIPIEKPALSPEHAMGMVELPYEKGQDMLKWNKTLTFLLIAVLF